MPSQIPSLELLMDLSEGQQELVVGGATSKIERSYEDYTYSEKRSSKTKELPQTAGNTPFLNSISFMTPFWQELNRLNQVTKEI